ncbi:hypothetical protein [Bradyrhizobium sp. JYMT SZCCT0180]|uniref:hypothetical protein n=1 Tax=Bradyrhizobium sp. JYMT SZCCT0180 TaxID=2807666 RepID=UPI001BA66AF8|nr:hypothetical protein [Bradyrhizobium sp. JYMT SZCCT0180]MBR1209463.1 hypothetical protein [Bradyrhizobium sp. JYMT SZCCT0180]
MIRGDTVVSMEELLVIGEDGAAESRIMKFQPTSAVICAQLGPSACSDAPLAGRTRVTLDGNRLQMRERTAATDPIDTPQMDPHIRNLAVSTTSEWTVVPERGGRRLVLHSAGPAWTAESAADGGARISLKSNQGDVRRILVKIDADALRAIWAGFVHPGLPPHKHWRCYLANATAADGAFADVLAPRHPPLSHLAGYLRVASYMTALDAFLVQPVADHPDPVVRKLVGRPVEQLMHTRFAGLQPPSTFAEVRSIGARKAYVAARAQGASDEAARAAIAGITRDEPLQIHVSDEEIAAYASLQPGSADFKRLFCSE